MFCPKCNAKLADDAKFCGVCGTSIEAQAEEAAAENAENQPAADEKVLVKPGKKSGFDVKKLIAIVAAVLVIVAAFFVIKGIVSSFGSKNAYVALADGKYKLITDLKKGESIKIDSDKSLENSWESSLVEFSPDGKYVYYYTDYSGDYGTLCRAEYAKLKKDSAKNDKYIEKIAKDVYIGFKFLDDGTLLYKNDDNKLCYYNGKDSETVAKDVSAYYSDGKKRVMYTVYDDDGKMTLYGVELKKLDDEFEIDTEVSDVYNVYDDDFDSFIYSKYDEDDYTYTYYAGSFGKDSEMIIEDANSMRLSSEGKSYFIADSGESVSLYDYVNDEYASADEGITEPNYEDYRVPSYRYSKITSGTYYLDEEDYDLYTSCTQDLYWYGRNGGWYSYYTMAEVVGTYSYEFDAEVVTATQNFINKYSGMADENGYIRVTDEVKAALKAINNYADTYNEDTWMWLCYDRYQYGYTTSDEYYTARDAWYEASDRISLREELKNKDNDFELKTIYCYENGKLTTVAENVVSTYGVRGARLFNTVDMITEKVDIDEISYTFEVESLFNVELSEESNVLLYESGSIVKMSEAAAEDFAEAYDRYFTNDSVYIYNDEDEEILKAQIKSGVVEEFTCIVEDAEDWNTDYLDENEIYYQSDVYTEEYDEFYDLYKYDGKESKCIVKDIHGARIYEDGVILASTDRDDNGYELTLFNKKGEKTKIADEVKRYVRVDKDTIMYISDGDLYSYNGKESVKIEKDVDYFWVKDSMDYTSPWF